MRAPRWDMTGLVCIVIIIAIIITISTKNASMKKASSPASPVRINGTVQIEILASPLQRQIHAVNEVVQIDTVVGVEQRLGEDGECRVRKAGRGAVLDALSCQWLPAGRRRR